MKLIIFTKNEVRKNLIISLLKETRKTSDLHFEYISKLSELTDTLLKDEFNIAGCILDFDGISHEDLDNFSSNIKCLNSKIHVLASSNYLLSLIPYFSVKNVCFEELLLELNNFIFRCEQMPRYSYKLKLHDSKCYLEEYYGDYLTDTLEILVTNFEHGYLRLDFLDKPVDTLVIKRMFGLSSNIRNIFGSLKAITAISNGSKHTLFPQFSISEMNKRLNK